MSVDDSTGVASYTWFWIDQICIYSYQTVMKTFTNLRLIPQVYDSRIWRYHF